MTVISCLTSYITIHKDITASGFYLDAQKLHEIKPDNQVVELHVSVKDIQRLNVNKTRKHKKNFRSTRYTKRLNLHKLIHINSIACYFFEPWMIIGSTLKNTNF